MSALRKLLDSGVLGGPGPQLKKLSPDQVAECDKYLKYHKFAALLIPGKAGINTADYEPGLDHRATTIDAIVRALGPLTLLNPVDELRDLVRLRYSPLVAVAITNAKATMKQQGHVLGPTNLVVKAGNNKAVLTWTAAPDATGYNVYRSKKSGDKGGTPIKSVTATYFADSGLINGQAYFYRVTASTPAGESMPSYEVSATPKEGEDVELSVGGETKDGTTEINYKIELKAKDEAKKIQVLPNLDLKAKVGDDGKAELVAEAQIDAIKGHIKKNLKLIGKVEIEVKVTINAQANLTGDKMGTLEGNIKGELEIKLKRITLSTSVEVGPTKDKPKPSAGFNVVLWRF